MLRRDLNSVQYTESLPCSFPVDFPHRQCPRPEHRARVKSPSSDMSLYPTYANAAYPPNPSYPPGHGYHGPPHRGPPGPPPPPLGPPAPTTLHVDPNAFRQFYASHLATLTFNSRPIIQNLSMMAQDFQRWASIVGQCLEAHIRRVSRGLIITSCTGFVSLESRRMQCLHPAMALARLPVASWQPSASNMHAD